MTSDPVERVTAALRALSFDVDMHLAAVGATHTAEQAAAEAACELGQIVKTLVVCVGHRSMFVLVPGDRRLDDRLIARRFGVGRKQVRLASPSEVLALTGYEVGGVSPFGTPTPIDTLIDDSFKRFQTLWLAGGAPNAIFPMALETVVKLTKGDFEPVAT
jgi:Cys-tRNA(Pro) deacylase